MAGSASNWFKPDRGPLKGQAVYLSKADRGTRDRVTVLRDLEQSDPTRMFQRPKGVAQPGGVKPVAPPPFTPRVFASDAELEAWGKSVQGEWAKGLTGEERRALYDADQAYTQGGAYPINGTLRKLPKALMDEMGWGPTEIREAMAFIPALDTALRKARLPEDVVTYRGLMSQGHEDAARLKKLWDQLIPGASFHDAGYQSSSLSRTLAADEFAWSDGGILFEMRVPKGSRGAYVNAHARSPFAYQRELLLPRDLDMTVVERKTVNGRRIVVVDVHDPERTHSAA
jgi:ADP-ribosyltransferase exoenzyme